MKNSFVKCDRCDVDQFPNQLKLIETPEGVIYSLCPDCCKELLARLASKGFVGTIMRHEMSVGEWGVLAREKAEAYAMSDFNMGVGA